MLVIRTTKLGYYAKIDFFKADEDVCCGQPHFYIVATDLSSGTYSLDLGIMDEDDYDICDWVYFTERGVWLRAFNFAICELYDKRYLRSMNLREAFEKYLAPLKDYLSAS